MYCTSDDVKLVFGSKNVTKWADANNNGNAGEIAARIAWAIESVCAKIDARLAIKFETPFDTTPTLIKNIAAEWTGIMLYQMPRGITDTDDTLSFGEREKEISLTLSKILNGQLKIDVTEVASEFPDVITQPNKSATDFS